MISPAGGKRGVDRSESCISRVILACPTVGSDGKTTHGGRGDTDRLGHLLVGKTQQLCGCNGSAECHDRRSVEARAYAAADRPGPTSPRGRTGNESVCHSSSHLISGNHRAQCFLSARARPIAHGQSYGRQTGPDVRNVAQVTVVGSVGVAEHRVHARRGIHRQLRSVEPQRRFGLTPLLLGNFPDDADRSDLCFQQPRRIRCWREPSCCT